uniref:RING-type domain-containing protein n=1 Tax=Eutreptiella gymnastica TaxID=73025 RepID=A0A7S1NHA6_9EUGL|mmetsp:Transcript_35136/g.62813  ORF Transcript_35136/g.62813 Transcript_35136/m.62813 type:complete len:297 (+) Transcript_35136:28-918(+)
MVQRMEPDAEMSRQNATNQMVIRARPVQQVQVTTPPQNKLQTLQSTPLRATRGVAATPYGKEKEIYPYYCPICMWYYRSILKTTCCGGQYLCEFCVHSLVEENLGRKPPALETFLEPVNIDGTCPFCSKSPLSIMAVKRTEEVRTYVDSPCDKKTAVALEYSPIKPGDTFEDLRRKMVGYNTVGYTQKLSVNAFNPSPRQVRGSSSSAIHPSPRNPLASTGSATTRRTQNTQRQAGMVSATGRTATVVEVKSSGGCCGGGFGLLICGAPDTPSHAQQPQRMRQQKSAGDDQECVIL